MPAIRLVRVTRPSRPFSDWTPECAAARFGFEMLGGPSQPEGEEATVCRLFVVTDDRKRLAVSVEPVRHGSS